MLGDKRFSRKDNVVGDASCRFGGDKKPHPIDRQVGANLRRMRQMKGMSQAALGERLDLTFQQVQKYEKGANRIGASKLLLMAFILDVPITSFFDGLTEKIVGEQFLEALNKPKLSEAEAELLKFHNSSEAVELVNSVGKLPAFQRRSILSLARNLHSGTGH